MEHQEHTTAIGTLTGTLLTVLATIDTEDVLKTVVLAGIGAIVSFTMSKFLSWIWHFFQRRK
jgi:tRNA A22 N-methylase